MTYSGRVVRIQEVNSLLWFSLFYSVTPESAEEHSKTAPCPSQRTSDNWRVAAFAVEELSLH
jgi:hypothetical protein